MNLESLWRVAETKKGAQNLKKGHLRKAIFKLEASLSPCSHSLLGSQCETTKPGLALSYFKWTFYFLCPGRNVTWQTWNCLWNFLVLIKKKKNKYFIQFYLQTELYFFYFTFYFYFFVIIIFFNLWWILSYIEMKQPWVYTCSPSQSPLPPPSPPAPSRFSQCTRSERLSHASNLGWWSVSP